MKEQKIVMVVAADLFAGGCLCNRCDGNKAAKVDAEEFRWYSNDEIGSVEPAEHGDFYVLRYEHPAKEPFPDGDTRKTLGIKWNFTEVRQLKDSVTIVEDGVLSKVNRRIPGCNWRKRLPRLSDISSISVWKGVDRCRSRSNFGKSIF